MSGDRQFDSDAPDAARPSRQRLRSEERAGAGFASPASASGPVDDGSAPVSEAALCAARLSAAPRGASPVRLFFGGCEFRVDSGELLRCGTLVRIAPQPSRVLHLLAQRSGQVVSRRELCDSVWSDGTCVDFEEGLNYCIKQLRRALEDDASSPRFIETVHRRGYRFVCPVRVEPVPPEVATVKRSPAAAGAARPAPTLARLVVLELAEIGRELPYPRFAATLSEELRCSLTERLVDRWLVVSGALERLCQLHREPGPGDLLLEGSVRADGEAITVALRLSALGQGRPLWTQRFEFPRAEDAEPCERRIVDRLVDRLIRETVPGG